MGENTQRNRNFILTISRKNNSTHRNRMKKSVFTGILCLVFALISLNLTAQTSIEETNRQAAEYYKAKNYDQAAKLWEKTAKKGDAEAQFCLGSCYEIGHGVPFSKSKAVKWWRKSAKQGFAKAQFCIGCCYYEGFEVEENFVEAVKWFRKSAEQGYADAQVYLGNCYYNGEGVAKDYSQARFWYDKAAKQGHELAKFLLQNMNSKAL